MRANETLLPTQPPARLRAGFMGADSVGRWHHQLGTHAQHTAHAEVTTGRPAQCVSAKIAFDSSLVSSTAAAATFSAT